MATAQVDAPEAIGDLLPAGRRKKGRRWRRDHVVALCSGGVLALLVGMALAAPLVAPYSPIETYVGPPRGAPSPANLLGTDHLGRDVLSRIIWGGQVSLRLGLISVTIGGVIGSIVGLLSGYYGGKVDLISQRFIDVLLAFPGVIIVLVVVAIIGPGLNQVMIAIGIGTIPSYTRLMRGGVLTTRTIDYVLAARVVGCPDRRIMFRHILPNVVAPVVVLSTLNLGRAILTSASVNFLGLGVQPPTPDWGLMVNEGRIYLRQAWWISAAPAMAVMLVVTTVNMLGDSLRDIFDPRLRGSR